MNSLQTVYFIEIYDHHDNQIELIGPFKSENEAQYYDHELFYLWRDDYNVKGSRILAVPTSPSASDSKIRKTREPGSAIGKLIIIADDEDHLKDFSEYLE